VGETLPRLFPNLPDRIVGLEDLAENLWWSWHPEARMLFKTLDRQVWKESGHNPDIMLRELPREVLEAAAADSQYLAGYDEVITRFERYAAQQDCRFLENMPDPKTYAIAYFSAEYGLHRSLPFYAGGLGFLAGDYLKECSDSCLPLVAVGFMYPEGYFRQFIREDGWQENRSEPIDREAAAISRVLDESGNQLLVEVPLTDPAVRVAIWRVAVGRVTLYLLDTDIDANAPWNRDISARLYVGDREQRLRQEIVLGLGGAKALQTLGISHYLLHLNEGHAAFALLERLKERIEAGDEFAKAVEWVRNTSIFTTHTPVPAGHDVFPFSMLERHFESYWPALGLDRDRFFQLGVNPEQPDAGFNMTAFALRLCASCNAVSKKHGEVSRKMWRGLWADRAEDEIPIESVTNGVHVPTWIEPKIQLLFDKYLGPDWLERHDDPEIWERLSEIPDAELWEAHYRLKTKLIDFIRERARLRWSREGASPSLVLAGGTFLDPSVLTIGFARRFATYKRADLLFYDEERLKRLVNSRWRPVQIVFGGKAHPADDPGKRILQRIVNKARDPAFGGRIVFVEDYGERLAQYLVHGVDVWLNNPLPPMEACGTSGMKAALNGVPQLSVLDGWWIEGFNERNGWAFPHEEVDGDPNRADAEKIYGILENEIVPLYYQVSEDGIPQAWIRIMKESMKNAAVHFSTRRMLQEYVEKFYIKALAAHRGE
jgi:starch phosphorylase